jgi:hypothetical protein
MVQRDVEGTLLVAFPELLVASMGGYCRRLAAITSAISFF